ncbi:MAG TPA: cytochrome c, partial [Blastocatellia bacterium]|nr:cytochrome c [Blastocatellia bacterium]
MRKVRMIPVIAVSMAAICLFALPATNANGDKKTAAKNVTFTKDVAPIFFKQCAECHREGEIAPFSVMSYKDVRPWAKSIREKVASREMPPWHADPSHGEWLNDR